MSRPKPPSKETLAKYGLSLDEWLDFAGDFCRICERPWSDAVKPVVDHEHVKGWKVMPPWMRRAYVRGVICRGCNYFVLTRHGTPLKFKNAWLYLEKYEKYPKGMGRGN